MSQNGRWQRIARVEARPLQIFQDIVQCWKTNCHFFRNIGPGRLFTITPVTSSQAVLQLDELAELRYTFSRFRRLAFCSITRRKHFEQSARSGIALRVNKCIIQWLNTIGDFEKARCLHKCSGAKTRYLLQFCTRFERAMFFAISEDGV